MSEPPEPPKPKREWWEIDPKCPGCGNIHPRERIGQSMSFVVHMDQKTGGGHLEPKCKYKGPIPNPK